MLLGLDLGTSSVKALLMDEDGAALGEHSVSYPVRSPRSGWAESSPEDWWSAVGEATGAVVGSRGSEVTAVGLSGQMHGVVLSGADGMPLRPAILWADTRSGEKLASYRRLDENLRRSLANPLAVGMAGPTLLWLRDEEPDLYKSTRRALQPKDWLRLRMTGEVATEPTDASATLLYDLEADDWALRVAEELGLRSDLLAPLVPSGSSAGGLSKEAAEHLSLRAGLPVAAGAGDAAAGALGSGLLEPGSVQLIVGTGAQIMAPRDRPVPDSNERTHLYRAATPNRWYSMAAIQNAGLALEWVRTVLGVTWEEVYLEAFAIPPGAGGVSFLPYLSGERTPHFDPGARGLWSGLGLDHGRGHLLRSALEGVAFALREGLEALEATGLEISELRLAGGGSLEPAWRQLLADILGRPLLVLPDPGVSARGAALLAGIACGVYSSVSATIPLAPGVTLVAEPGEESEIYDEPYSRYLSGYSAHQTR